MIEAVPAEASEVVGRREAADGRPRFDDGYIQPGFKKRVRRGQSRNARSDDCDARFHRFAPTITTPKVIINTAIQRFLDTCSRKSHPARMVTTMYPAPSIG